MKKIAILFFTLMMGISAFAQKDNYIKPSLLGVHFFFEDFQTPQDLVHNNVNDVVSAHHWNNTKFLTPGIAVDYMKGITRHLDFAAALSGSYTQYPTSDKTVYAAPTNIDPSKSVNQSLLLDVTASLNLKLLSDRYIFTPYLIGGIGSSLYQSEVGVFAPLGVGIQANIKRQVYFFLTSQYRVHITDNTADHLYHSLGIAGNMDNNREKAAKPLPTLVAAPAVAVAPVDTDGDGIPDADDKCPTVAGTAKYHGCPIPDTDHDGINDEEDKCPTVAGVAKYQGCPIPDTDNDGVNDEEDKCPTVAGPASNFGCPVIEKSVVDKINYAAKNIFFATGSDKLLPQSSKSLTEVAKIMSDNPSLKLSIDGYTDNTGDAAKNVALSQKRADAVKAFLVNNKVEAAHLTAAGHGSDKPLADNKTAAGRAQNRRVELGLTNY
jgi:OOP family OmpA-OmpF porin